MYTNSMVNADEASRSAGSTRGGKSRTLSSLIRDGHYELVAYRLVYSLLSESVSRATPADGAVRVASHVHASHGGREE